MTPFKQANKSFVFIHPDGTREQRSYSFQGQASIQKNKLSQSKPDQECFRILARLGFNGPAFANLNPHLSPNELVARAKKIVREGTPLPRHLALRGAVRNMDIVHRDNKNTSNRASGRPDYEERSNDKITLSPAPGSTVTGAQCRAINRPDLQHP